VQPSAAVCGKARCGGESAVKCTVPGNVGVAKCKVRAVQACRKVCVVRMRGAGAARNAVVGSRRHRYSARRVQPIDAASATRNPYKRGYATAVR